MHTNRDSGTMRGARRHILAMACRPAEVTTELSGMWKAIKDSREHQHKKGNKLRRMEYYHEDSRQ